MTRPPRTPWLLFVLLLTVAALLAPMAIGPPAALAEPNEPAKAKEAETDFPPMDTEGLVELKSDHFRVYATPNAVEGFSKILARSDAYRERINDQLGFDDPAPLRVVVIEDLNDYFRRRGMSPRAPEWAIGLAMSSEDTVLVKWGRSETGQWVDMEKTFVHELAHIALDRKVGAGGEHIHGGEHVSARADGKRRVPRWFHEGFAIAQAGEWSIERSTVMMEAGVGGNIMSMHDLREGFPASGRMVEVAYAQSHNFLLYLDDRFGPDKRIRLLDLMAEGRTFEDAFFKAYKVDFSRVEADWHDRMNVAYSWVPAALGSTTIWFGGGLLFVWAYARRRKRDKARMEALDDHTPDQPEAPIPLPGLGLEESHVRSRSIRVFSDGSFVRDGEEPHARQVGNDAWAALAADEDLKSVEALQPVDAVYTDEYEDDLDEDAEARWGDDVPRNKEGFTLH